MIQRHVQRGRCTTNIGYFRIRDFHAMARNISTFILVLFLTGMVSCVRSDNKNKEKRSQKMKPEVSQVETAGSILQGKVLFIQYCSACHGNDGKKGINGAKDLTTTNKGIDKILKRINEGKGNMPSFREILNDKQMIDIANYINSELKYQ